MSLKCIIPIASIINAVSAYQDCTPPPNTAAADDFSFTPPPPFSNGVSA
jgi:hypothetical protein